MKDKLKKIEVVHSHAIKDLNNAINNKCNNN